MVRESISWQIVENIFAFFVPGKELILDKFFDSLLDYLGLRLEHAKSTENLRQQLVEVHALVSFHPLDDSCVDGVSSILHQFWLLCRAAFLLQRRNRQVNSDLVALEFLVQDKSVISRSLGRLGRGWN